MRRIHAVVVVLVLALAFAFSCAVPVFAQVGSGTAQLSGTVRDEAGGAVAGASISLRELDTNRSYNATASEKGFYAFVNLPPGRYELKVSYKGFANYVQTGIVLTVGQSATNDVTLKVAAKGEQVVVTSEVPTIEPTKTEISQVIQTRQIDSLPISSRLFTDFALLTPSVATSRTSLGTTFTDYETTQISFGGQRSFNNQITVDGADYTNMLTGVQRATPPQESVQEFRVVNNSFGAEYGRALGGIVNIVTKGGTNDFHGSIYEYFQNQGADARSLLQPAATATTPAAPDTLRSNQFGATAGGPIQKDKLFFFLNYDGKRQANSPIFAPSLFNNITVLDQAKAYLGLSPEGCFQPLAQCTGTPQSYLNSVLKTNDNDYGFARLDYQVNKTNQVSVRYNIEDARDLGELIGQTEDGGGVGTPSGARNLFVRDQSLSSTWTTELKPTLINTFLFQYARRHYNFPGATGEPDLSVVNDLEFGHNFGTFDQIFESRVEFSDSLGWVKGKHIAKFGFDGNYIWDHNNYPGFEPERILLTDLNCLVYFADYVNSLGFFGPVNANIPPIANLPPCAEPPNAVGIDFLYWGVTLPRTTNIPNGMVPSPAPPTGGGFGSGWPNAFPTDQFHNFDFNLNHGYWGVYAQDQWRVTPKLTLNYGLRWDFESGLSNFSNSDYTAFAPRVGFAYSPDGKTVIRAGFGIFFDRNNQTFYFVTGNQKIIPGYLCNPPSANPGCSANGFTGGVVAPQVQKGSATGGWQLNALPGGGGSPTVPCVAIPFLCSGFGGQTMASITALTALNILADQPYDPVTLTGPCVFPATGACGVGAGGIQRNGRIPYAEQASLEVSHSFGGGFTLNVGYLFVGAHKLVRGNNLNIPCPVGTSKPGNPAYAQGWLNPDGTQSDCAGTPMQGPLGLGPFFASLANPSGLEFGPPEAPGSATLFAGLLDFNNNVVNANYHGLNVTALERIGRYFNLTANYTYSHSIDNGNFTTFINLPINQFNYHAERANSNQDTRHRFVANFTATAPDDTWFRQFNFSSIITLQSGRPFTLFVGENTFGDVAGLSTDRVGGPPVAAVCNTVADCNTVVARNTYIGDPLYTWDLRLGRYFKLTERVKLDLAVDVFNFFNRANVDEITSVYGSPVFCGASPQIPRHYNDGLTKAIRAGTISCASQQMAANPGAFLGDGLLPVTVPDTPNPNFGLPRTALNPRQLQFSAKFSF